MTLTHSMLMPLLQLFAENASVAVEGNQSCVRNYRLAFDLAKGDGNFGSANTREYLFPMHFAAGLVDDNYCNIWVFERVFVAKPPCKIFAMLNRTKGCFLPSRSASQDAEFSVEPKRGRRYRRLHRVASQIERPALTPTRPP